MPESVPDLDAPPGDTGGATRRKGVVERVEEGVSIAFFVAMFVTVIVGIFWRYVLDTPLIWTVNAATIAFIWVIMIGSGPPNRDNEHIQFDLVYKRRSPATRRVLRIVGNLLIIVPFAVAIPHTIDYLRFVRGNKVTGLDLTFDWAYGGVLIFLVATIAHRGRLLLADLRGRPEEEQ